MTLCNNIKRASLISIPISGLLIYFYIEILNNTFIRILIGSFNCIIMFINFPVFIKVLHTKPVYYEDILIIDKYASQSNPYHLQQYFLYINGITTIIFVVVSTEYLYQSILHNSSFVNTIGTIGGLNVIYSKLQTYFGKSLLSLLYYIKKRKYSDTSNTLSDIETQATIDTNMPWLWAWHNNLPEQDN